MKSMHDDRSWDNTHTSHSHIIIKENTTILIEEVVEKRSSLHLSDRKTDYAWWSYVICDPSTLIVIKDTI